MQKCEPRVKKFSRTIKTKALKEDPSLIGEKVTVKGWVRTLRNQKTFAFIELNDGSQLSNLQIIADSSLANFDEIVEKATTGAAISVTGELKESPGDKQAVEVHASIIVVLGDVAPDYQLQKKRHSFEFLRTLAHLRPRTNTFGAVTRVRNSLAYATHNFFQERGFSWIHTPLITSSDCEGHGEMFAVTTLDLGKLPKTPEGAVDYSKDFFGKPAFLTVSGQLNVEAYAMAMSDTYTFGPTFRAENSNTSRHLAEFWMIEPEIAFATLEDNMNLAEDYLHHVVDHLFQNNTEDLEFFDQFVEKGLIERLKHFLESPPVRISYTDAIQILLQSGKKFEFPVSWGCDLQSEHERFLTETHFKSPVFVYNYPTAIKSFYMRRNEDGKTVAAMDLLVPVTGELMGGSAREERYDVLMKILKEKNFDFDTYGWFLELRKYGTAPHAGFGVGFERLIQYTTGMENIRDVIPFPRYPGHADF